MKKLLAILCTVALLLGTVLTGLAVSAETTITEITPADFTVSGSSADGYVFSGGGNWANVSTGFVNTTLTAMIMPLQDTPAIHIYNGWAGGLKIELRAKAGQIAMANTVYEIGKTLAKTPFKFQMTCTEVETGLNFDVYVDDVLVVDDFVMSTEDAQYANVVASRALYNQGFCFYSVGNDPVPAANEIQKAPFGALKPVKASDWVGFWPANGPDVSNSVFDADIILKNGENFQYFFQSWVGLNFTATADSISVYDNFKKTVTTTDTEGNPVETQVERFPSATITKEMAGTAVVNNRINIKLVTEVLNLDGEVLFDDDDNIVGEYKNDVRFTVYINNTSVYTHTIYANVIDNDGVIDLNIADGFIELSADKTKLLSGLYVANMGTAEFLTPEVKLPVMLESTTQIKPDSTYNTDVTMPEGAVLDLGAYGKLTMAEGTLTYTDMSGKANAVAGDYLDKKFNLKVTVRMVDVDADERADDNEIGIFVNNKNICAMQYKADSYFDLLAPVAPVATAATLSAADQRTDGLRTVTSSDAGYEGALNLGEGNPGHANNAWLDANFVDTDIVDIKLAGYITVEEAKGIMLVSIGGKESLYLYGDTDGDGVGQMKVLFNGAQWLFEGGANSTYNIGEEFLYEVTIEKADVDFNGDGIFNDLRFGYFVNGKLVNDSFAYANAANAGALDMYYTTEPDFWMQTTEKFVGNIRPIDRSAAGVPELPTFTPAQLNMPAGTYTGAGALNAYVHAGRDIENMNIKSTVNWTGGNVEFCIGAIGSSGGGIRFNMNNGVNATAVIRRGVDTGSINLPDLTAGVDHELIVSIKDHGDFVYEIGFWVDGKLQNNRTYFTLNNAAKFDPYMSFWDTAATWTFGFDATEPEGVVGGSSYTVKAGYTINGEAVAEDTVLTEIGAYEVAYTGTFAGSTIGLAENKLVVIYVENDLTADGAVNILDFIAMNKNIADELDLSPVAAFAAGVELDGKCTSKELIALKKAILFAM